MVCFLVFIYVYCRSSSEESDDPYSWAEERRLLKETLAEPKHEKTPLKTGNDSDTNISCLLKSSACMLVLLLLCRCVLL